MRDMFANYANHVTDVFGSIVVDFPVKALSTSLVLIFQFLFGIGNNSFIVALVALVCFDFITGVLAAFKGDIEITSRRAVKTAFKLAAYGLLISAGHMTDVAVLNANIFDQAIISFLAVTEMISIIENTGKMGYGIPKKLLEKLLKIRDDQ